VKKWKNGEMASKNGELASKNGEMASKMSRHFNFNWWKNTLKTSETSHFLICQVFQK